MAETKQMPRGSNVEQLRADIDAGRTGDKVAYPDPAAAPLGADDEAAGRPARPGRVEGARLGEAASGPQSAARAGTPDGSRGARPRFWLLVALAAAAVAGFLLLGTIVTGLPQ